MKRGNEEVEPNSSPETWRHFEKAPRRFSPVQPQVRHTLSYTGQPGSQVEINMDQAVLEQALTGAPDWAVNMAKLLVAQSDSVKQEMQDLYKAVEFAQTQAIQAEKLATEASKELKEMKRKFDEVKFENAKLHDRLVNLEAHSRRDNLLVYGVPEVQGRGNGTVVSVSVYQAGDPGSLPPRSACVKR